MSKLQIMKGDAYCEKRLRKWLQEDGRVVVQTKRDEIRCLVEIHVSHEETDDPEFRVTYTSASGKPLYNLGGFDAVEPDRLPSSEVMRALAAASACAGLLLAIFILLMWTVGEDVALNVVNFPVLCSTAATHNAILNTGVAVLHVNQRALLVGRTLTPFVLNPAVHHFSVSKL